MGGDSGTHKIRKTFDSLAVVHIKDLAGLGDKDEESAIVKQVNEWVHVVRLSLHQEWHHDRIPFRYAVGAENLVGRVVVCIIRRIESVQASRSHKKRTIRHCLYAWVPSSCVQLVTWLSPVLPIRRIVLR